MFENLEDMDLKTSQILRTWWGSGFEESEEFENWGFWI